MGSKSKVRPQENCHGLDLSVPLSGKRMKPEPFRDCTPGGAVDLCSEAIGTRTASGNAGTTGPGTGPTRGRTAPAECPGGGCQRCSQPFPSLPNSGRSGSWGVVLGAMGQTLMTERHRKAWKWDPSCDALCSFLDANSPSRGGKWLSTSLCP